MLLEPLATKIIDMAVAKLSDGKFIVVHIKTNSQTKLSVWFS